jgi:hypothetical protein
MSIWDKYPNYSGEELRTLVALSAQALLDLGTTKDDVVPKDILRASTQTTSRELFSSIRGEGVTREQIQEVLEDDELAAKACLEVLDQVRTCQPLADHIADTYEASSRKMVVPELLLLAGSLLVLCIKVKEINFAGKKVTFYKADDAVKSALTGLIKLGG